MSESVRDVRMLAKAAIRRWPVEDRYRSAAVTRLMQVIADKSASERAVTTAVKALIAMEKQNQKDEHKIVDVSLANQPDRLSAILGVADTLGIDPSVINPSAAAASHGDQSPDQSRLQDQTEKNG